MKVCFINSDPEYPEAVSSDPFGIAGGFLSTEIHVNSSEWILGIRSAENENYSWEYSGNAYGLSINNNKVKIIGYYVSDDEEFIILSSAEFIALLNSWLIFLQNRIETDIDVKELSI